MSKNVCGECKFYLVRGVCPKAEYKKRDLNVVACFPTDVACELFQQKYKKQNGEEPKMEDSLELLNKHIFKCPTDTEKVLIYIKGTYINAKPTIWKMLETKYGEQLKRNFVDESYAHLQRANTIDRQKINQFTNTIPIQNGLFNILTREVTPFDSEQVFTYKLGVTYNPEHQCQKWIDFVKQVVTKDDIPLLQEIMGYCLLPDMPYHKMFWLYGTGRNGKGVVIRTIEAIIGKENCSTLNLSEFTEGRRFSLQKLYGKFMNISSEPKISKYGIQTTVLKMVTGEDTIDAELKGKNTRLKFVNHSKLIVLGNHFPKVDDNSLGWWDRVVVLKFPNSFEGKNKIVQIERNWVPEELSGIFNWMLEGLYRIAENNGFSTSEFAEETKTEFMKVSDPFNAWIIENCILIPNAYLIRDEALTAYFDYCDEIGADRDSKRIFFEKMRQTPKIKDIQKKIHGKAERVFEGITLKNERYINQTGLMESQSRTSRTLESAVHHNSTENNNNIEQIKNSVNSATFATNNSMSIPEPKQILWSNETQKTLRNGLFSTWSKESYYGVMAKIGFDILTAERIFKKLEDEGHIFSIDFDKSEWRWV